MKITTEKAIATFGFDPATIGNRHRDWGIVDWEDEDFPRGYLWVEARDGASNPPDFRVGRHDNFVDSREGEWDSTYRYYYFAPLKQDA